MKPDRKDLLLQNLSGFDAVPMFGEFVALEENKRRYLLTRNGVFLEYKSDWAYCLTEVAKFEGTHSAPFGEVTPSMQFENASQLVSLIKGFAAENLDNPIEAGVIVAFDKVTRQYALLDVRVNSATTFSLDYEAPALGANQVFVGDIHTHGFSGAGFSGIDDKDDKDAFKLAITLGNLNQANITMVSRMCMGGMFVPMPSRKFTRLELLALENVDLS
jgi:PRTRC genetic system protein A